MTVSCNNPPYIGGQDLLRMKVLERELPLVASERSFALHWWACEEGPFALVVSVGNTPYIDWQWE